MRSFKGFAICLFLAAAFSLSAYASNIYTDPLFRNWSEMFIRGELGKLIISVETNMQSGNEHPLARYVWLNTHKAAGDLEKAVAEAPSWLRIKVEGSMKINKKYSNEEYPAVVESYKLLPGEDQGQLFVMENVVRASAAIDTFLTVSLIEKMAAKFPDNFAFLRQISQLSQTNDYLRNRLTYSYNTGRFPGKENNKFIKDILSFLPVNDYQIIHGIKEYLIYNPDDALANRFMGQLLSSVERYNEANPYFERSFQLDPFYGINLGNIAENLAKIQKYEDARAMVKRIVHLYYPSDSVKSYFTQMAGVLSAAGNLGRMRSVLDSAISLFPDDPGINSLYGDLESGSSRYEKAVIFYIKASNREPENNSYRLKLINALSETKEYEKAWESISQILKSDIRPGSSFYTAASRILKSLGETKEAVSLLQTAYPIFPNEGSLLRVLSDRLDDNGMTDKSLEFLNMSFTYYRPYGWSIAKLVSLYDKKQITVNEKAKYLEDLIKDYYWVEELWQEAEKLKPDAAEKETLWKNAALKNPGRLFPYENLRYMYAAEGQWNKITDILETNEPVILKSGSEEDKINLYFEKAIVTVLKLRKARISSSEANKAIESFEKYLSSGGRHGAYYQYIAEIYETFRDYKKACEYMSEALIYRPDDQNIVSKLNTRYASVVGSSRGAIAAYEYFERNPYDRQRVGNLILWNSRWNGTPVNCLNLIHFARINGLDSPSFISSEAMAYGQLGDNIKNYELTYRKINSIAASMRYIDWYTNAVSNIWSGNANIEMDYETNTAKISYPDGTIAYRQDDLRLGKITRLQVGDAYISAMYYEDGNLKNIESSAGKNILFEYYENDRIAQISDNKNNQLKLEYNESGKPSAMLMKGTGRLVIEYDSVGEVRSLSAFDKENKQTDYSIAGKIQNYLSELTGLANSLENGAKYLSAGKLPDLGITDEIYATLSEKYEAASLLVAENSEKARVKDQAAYLSSGVELARYMFGHSYADPDYGPGSLKILSSLFDYIKSYNSKSIRDYVIEVVQLSHSILNKVRKQGIALEMWGTWAEMQDWLEKEKLMESSLSDYRKKTENLQKTIAENPVVLLASSEWLPKSSLQVNGFWKNYSFSSLFHEKTSPEPKINTLYYRKNGDLLMGSDKGLFVMRKGFWEHFSYDVVKSEFIRSVNQIKPGNSDNITAFGETDDGRLFAGTAGGLIELNVNYAGKINNRYGQVQGLNSVYIKSLAPYGNNLLIGTLGGLYILSANTIAEIPSFYLKEILSVKSFPGLTLNYNLGKKPATPVLINSKEGVYLAYFEGTVFETRKLLEGQRDDVILLDDGLIYTLVRDEAYRIVERQDDMGAVKIIETNLFGNIIATDTRRTFGLVSIPVNENDNALGVLTDLGISVYHQDHFEHFYLPGNETAKNQARTYSQAGNTEKFAVAAQNGMLIYNKAGSKVIPGRINDILSSEKLGYTFIADGKSLKYIINSDESGTISSLEGYGTTSLALDRQNRLVANEGSQIVRYTFNADGTYKKEELFYCQQTEDSEYKAGPLNDIMIDSKGNIWVTTGLSLFLFNESEGNASASEYNFFRNPDRFPSKTEMLYKTFETIDKRIIVVCSNEGHLQSKGLALSGGLLEWQEGSKTFKELSVTDNYAKRGFNWFITGYTPVSETKAIVGTIGGFAEDNMGEIRDYYQSGGGINNPSYNEIFDEKRSLFLGTEGARIGDLWLFGSASGILGFYNGIWFYPDKLNQLLPDDSEYGEYGARLVTSVSADNYGKIFIGTYRGLLIYDLEGADPVKLLMDNDLGEKAVSYFNSEILAKESDILTKDIPKSSETGKLLSQISDVKKKMDEVQVLKARDQNDLLHYNLQKVNLTNQDSLIDVVTNLKRRQADLLLQLQQREPAIYQSLQLQPLDLIASAKNMNDDECIIQYIPMQGKLYIQFVSKTRLDIKEVIIERKVLMDTCKYISKYLSWATVNAESEAINPYQQKTGKNYPAETLEYLYEQLLRPVEIELNAFKNIYIAPASELSDIPFGALIDRISSNEKRYAIEKYNIGYLSSIYLFNLIHNFKKEDETGNILILGDPDFTLSGAKEEADAISELFKAPLKFTGNGASIENFLKYAGESKYIHLATHGRVNPNSLKDSWLLFANNKRYNMSEAYSLPLDKTEMVVLSACETALGGEGMEYFTLARAFSNAGAGTILGTLWQVDDLACKELMTRFYSNLISKQNKFEALANAQRQMIKSDNLRLNHPSKWAPYIVIGKY